MSNDTPSPAPPADALDELERLANNATPGPWKQDDGDDVRDPNGESLFYAEDDYGNSVGVTVTKTDDALFIAAANPAAVLALIARCRAAERARAAAEAERDAAERDRDQQKQWRAVAEQNAHAAESDLIDVYNALWPDKPHDWVPGEVTGTGKEMVEAIAALRRERDGLRAKVEEMRRLIPHTADGVPIQLGMRLYRRATSGVVLELGEATSLEKPFKDEAWWVDGTHCNSPACDLYSTREAALAPTAGAAPGEGTEKP